MIIHSRYKNKSSIVLENIKLRAEFIPAPGGKLASLINKETGYEYLLQRANKHYRDQSFAGVYVDGECSGFDDMFPTIDACRYGNEPWEGVEMADHGEVWSLPWRYLVDNDTLRMSVTGVRFPYTLEKEVYFTHEDSLRIDYTLTNNSPYDFEFLWAGHLMLNMEEGTRVEVPEGCKQVVTVLSNGGRKFGDVSHWPFLKDNLGNTCRADIARAKAVKGFEKYYFTGRLTEGWCRLKYPDNKNSLKISFPESTVPYLGILMNEGGWDELYNIIIEPCTVCYDRPDVAKEHGQVSKVGAKGTYKWYIEIMA
ncbi:hypothetical protein D1164_16720 [Mariniphaga sediminis]|uniref:DUF5107 domain-containing protein n=1 Tax=Mariniphaga sediminis TaxID=1628158 RepID=A0A399CX87_9BACT|nr:hypothetical protein [Mariniphaga sediminis]RIH63977.1 hypothetical protein D1164_16720 [Mariniphaga sediminis]